MPALGLPGCPVGQSSSGIWVNCWPAATRYDQQRCRHAARGAFPTGEFVVAPLRVAMAMAVHTVNAEGRVRYTRSMPSVLASRELQLSSQEAVTYRAAV